MGKTAAAARLVTPAGSALGLAAGLLGAIAGTVKLAAVAAAADEHVHTAAGAQEKPAWRLNAAAGMWTKTAMGGILPPHSCPARCWGVAPIRLGR